MGAKRYAPDPGCDGEYPVPGDLVDHEGPGRERRGWDLSGK